MKANGIECHTATKATNTSGLDYRTMSTTKVSADTLVVDMVR